MKKPLLILAATAALATGAYLFFAAAAPSAPEGYANRNVAFGAVSTDAANQLCPQQGHEKLVCLADALKGSASDELLNELQRPYSVAEASRWSNFPPFGYPDRVGPTLGDFTPEQLGLIKAILVEAAGIAANEGYDELEQILNADDFLVGVSGTGPGFSSSNFHFAFLGTPAATGTWQLYFGGHHTAVSNTYTDGKLTGATPSFRGVEPFTAFEMNGRTNQPMAQEQAAFAAMLGGLTPVQREAATLDQVFTDIVVGPQKDDNFPTQREGQRVGDLTESQRALVLAAIATYVRDIDPRNADAIMARYESQLADTYIAFSGTPGMATENDYVRIDGPTLWIELSMQPGREVEGIHPHSIWRDRAGDYGGN
jgi:hypothetical protein